MRFRYVKQLKLDSILVMGKKKRITGAPAKAVDGMGMTSSTPDVDEDQEVARVASRF